MPTERINVAAHDRGWQRLKRLVAKMKRDRANNRICKTCGEEIPRWAASYPDCPDCRYGSKANAD